MSIANRVDCVYCFSSPCRCSKEDIRTRIEEEEQRVIVEEDIENYLNR